MVSKEDHLSLPGQFSQYREASAGSVVNLNGEQVDMTN